MTTLVGRPGMAGVARGSAANLAGAVVAAASTFVLTVVVTRGLSPSDAGVFFSVTSLFLVGMSLSQLGTDAGLVYFVSRARALGSLGDVGGLVRSAVLPVAGTGLLVAGAGTVLAADLGALTNPGHAEEATSLIRSVVWFIPLAGLETVALAATRGLGTMRPSALTEQVARPSLQLLLVTVAVSTAGPDLAALAWGAAYLPAAAMAWLWWRRLWGALDRSADPGPVGGQAREFWTFTAPRSVASVAQLLMQRLDIVLVGALAGASQAALYAAATRFVVAGQMGRQAVSLAAQPALAAALAREDTDRARQVFQVSAAWLMAVTWPLFLTFAVVGGPLLHVFGPTYEAGADVLQLLSLAMLVATACGDVDNALIMAGKTTWSLANMAVALTLNLGLDLWLIPGHGVLGAAIGWSVAIVVKNLLALVQVWFALDLHPFGSGTLRVALLALATFGVVPWLCSRLVGTDLSGLLIGLAAAATCYLAGLYAWRRLLELDSLLDRGRRSG